MSSANKIILIVVSVIVTLVILSYTIVRFELLDKSSFSQCRTLFLKENYRAALSACRSEFNSSGLGEYYTARILKNGLSVSTDKVAARRLMLASAKMGFAEAQLQVANSAVVAQDWQEALYWYKKVSSEKSIAYLRMAEIDYLLYKKDKKPKLMRKVISNLNQANDNSVIESRVILAELYSQGVGVSKSNIKARELLKSFLSSGSNLFLNDQNQHFQKYKLLGSQVSFLSQARMLYGVLLYQAKIDYKEALNLMQSGRITRQSAYYIAEILNSSLIGKPDYTKAFSWYEKAASIGNDDAQLKLSMFYLKGIFVKKDSKKALKILTDLANKNNTKAMLVLASLYERGIYVVENRALSLKWYLLASKNGSRVAVKKIQDIKKQNELSNKSQNYCMIAYSKLLEGDEVSRPMMRNACLLSAKNGNLNAQAIIADLRFAGIGFKQNQKAAISELKLLVLKNNAIAIAVMSDFYISGVCNKCKHKPDKSGFTLKKDRKKGIQLALKYIYHPDQNVETFKKQLVLLGRVHKFGIFGRAKNYKKAFNFFTMASKLKSPEADYYLGLMYWFGEYVPINTDKALQLFLKADQYIRKPSEALCAFYMRAAGHIDYKKAFVYCSKGADFNYRTSMYSLGEIYRFGLGVSKDDKRARYWYEKSSALGYKRASLALSKLNNINESELSSDKSHNSHSSLSAETCQKLYSRAKQTQKTVDYRLAMRKCQVGAARGVKSDSYYAAVIRFSGLGVREDKRNAMRILRKLSGDNFAPATNFLAMIYYHGICATCRYKSQNNVYRLQQNIKEAEFYVNRYQTNPAKSISTAISQLNSIGKYYFFSKKGDSKENTFLAYRYFTRAYNLGSPLATWYLAHMHLSKRHTPKQNINEGLRLLYLLADKNYDLSYPTLCDFYFYEPGRIDYQKGLPFCQKAADAGYRSSMYVLGKYFLDEKKTEKGRAWIVKSANKGFKPAIRLLKKINEKK